MELTPIKRLSSSGFWCRSLEKFFEHLPILWKEVEEVEEVQSRKELLDFVQSEKYTGKLKSFESRQKLAETIRSKHQSIIIKSREAADCYEQFQYECAHDSTFSEQAPIRTSFKSPFSTRVVRNFNPDDTSNSEILIESIKRAACLLFQKKQDTFLKRLSEMVNHHKKWMNYFINHEENHNSLQIIKRLFTQAEICGMDLNLLFFQADIYLSVAFEVMKFCEGTSIYDIEPSRFFLAKKNVKIFLFEEHKTLNYYCETFQYLEKEKYAEFDRFLENYVNKKEIEAKKPAAEKDKDNDDTELEDILNWALKWIEE